MRQDPWELGHGTNLNGSRSRAQPLSIAGKELILACNTWGQAWNYQRVLCRCDNKVVVACLRSRTSWDEGVMHLLRCLTFIEARHNCFLSPEYITTKDNYLADALAYHGMMYLLSYSRFLQPIPTHHDGHTLFWTSSWTFKPTGHHHPGAGCSKMV